MAHAYTTKRGKDKMKKLGSRMDSQSKDTYKMMAPKPQSKAKAEEYVQPSYTLALDGAGKPALRLEGVKERLQDKLQASIERLQLQDSATAKCANPACPTPSPSKLSACSAW